MSTKPNKNEYATKGDLRELRTEINEDFKVHVGVLYEKFENEVKVVAESHLDIDRKVDKLSFKGDLLAEKVDGLAEKVYGLANKVDELNDKTGLLIETVGEIKVDVADIKDSLKNKVDLKDHKSLEKRVSVLEATA